jgi:phosphatidylethanolamine/phosphatidyl-N-methylethanolamine N-methyltransferase
MLAKQDRLFLKQWVRGPFRMGALAPSGPALARLMAHQVDPKGPGTVVELGPGTGSITAALLEAGVAPERLILVEREEELCRWLKNRFPRLRILHEDAAHLAQRLVERGIVSVEAVVSSLPLLSMPPRTSHAIIDQAFGVLGPSGALIQFTYGPRCPIPRSLVARHGFEARPAGTAWLNLPPATVWRMARPVRA